MTSEDIHRTFVFCHDRMKEFERLRDQYAYGSRSHMINEGKADVFRDLAQSAKHGDPDLIVPPKGGGQ